MHHQCALRSDATAESFESETASYLPEEVITGILVRVPVKSLLKFRCVSKSWLNLINNPYFTKLQLKLIASSSHPILVSEYMDDVLKSRFLCSHSFPPQVDPHTMNLTITKTLETFPDNKLSINIVGSCDGLVCLRNLAKDHIIIWNPSTRKQWLFQEPPVMAGFHSRVAYGFGYDALNNDYKIVRGWFHFGGEKYAHDIQICSLRGDNQWRRVKCDLGQSDIVGKDSFSIRFGPLNYNGVLVNGAIHWKALVPDYESKGCPVVFIIAMNLTSETFSVLAPPTSVSNGTITFLLGASNDAHLCLACNYYDRMNVWRLKEYSVVESWTKVLCVGRDSIGNGRYEFDYVLNWMNTYQGHVQLLVSENGVIAVKFKEGVWEVYTSLKGVMDSTSNNSWNYDAYLKSTSLGSDHYIKFGCTTYIETLVSL